MNSVHPETGEVYETDAAWIEAWETWAERQALPKDGACSFDPWRTTGQWLLHVSDPL